MVEESVIGHVIVLGVIFSICYLADWLMRKF